MYIDFYVLRCYNEQGKANIVLFTLKKGEVENVS